LRDLLLRDADDPNSSHDFGNDLIPDIVKNGKAVAHRFSDSCVKSGLESEPYWRDVGTIDAFWQANIDLTDFIPKLDIYDQSWPIWTYAEILPPAKFIHNEDKRRGSAVSSLVSGDCIVSGSEVRNSLLFTGCRTHSFATLDHVVALPQVIVNRKAELKNCVVDRGVIIPEGLVVGQDPEMDAKWFRRTDAGIVLITQDMIDARSKALS
jgi:glucose-1-phosphate adenylyltransferase